MASVTKRKWKHNGVEKSAWAVRYVVNGKQKQRTFKAKKDADRYAAQVTTDLAFGAHVPEAETTTVRKACDLYLKHAEDRIRDGRIGRSRHLILKYSVDRSIIPHLGNMRFADLKPTMIEEWYVSMCRQDGLQPKTAKERVYILREIEDFAIKRQLAKDRPVAEAMKSLRGIRAKPIRTFNVDDVQVLLRAAAERKPRGWHRPSVMMNLIVNLAAFCGLRYGEIMGLTLANVGLDRGLLRVRHSLTAWDELKVPKTRAGVRDVPVPHHVRQLLGEWLEQHYAENDRHLIFRAHTGGPMGASNFHNQLWGPLLKRAGLATGDRFHFHALRHFAASWMIEHGLPVTEVALLLGHSKYDMTLQTYAHPIVGSQRRHEVIERMAGSLLLAPLPLDCTTDKREIASD